MAIDNAKGDVILFLDEDAVAEERWVEKYENLFDSLPNVGGISGVTYKAYIESGMVVKTYELFYDEQRRETRFIERR
jgi:GT2 family glycosyltransferase